MADPFPDPRPAYMALLNDIKDITSTREFTTDSFEDFESAVLDAFRDSASGVNISVRTALAKSIVKLAAHAHDAILNETNYFDELIQILTVATREEPIWRSQFGGYDPALHESHFVSMQDPEPDCILELARRVCTLNYRASEHAIENALRIIGNCCADDNDNRRLIIHRDGIESLLRLCLYNVDQDFVVAALFNVCTDYDEPAQFLGPRASGVSLDNMGGTTVPTLAIERLALANRFNPNFTTFELLLRFWNRLSWHMLYILDALIEMSTEPALSGFENIRADLDAEERPWRWSFTVNGDKFDTIAVAAAFSAEEAEFAAYVSKSMVNVLSQQAARDALFRRNDDSIWTLLTAVYGHQELDDEMLELDDESPYDELSASRRAFLKILYAITGDTRFCEPGSRASALLEKSIAELDKLASFFWTKRTQRGTEGIVQQTNQPATPHLDARDAFLISACVIISQLCGSDQIRDELLPNEKLTTALVRVFASVSKPDVLYPALTIVTRLSLTSTTELPLVAAGIMQEMQYLLTAKGKGLIVPLETVTAYKTIIRGRPHTIGVLLTRGRTNRKFMEDIFNLWSITVEAGTKLEIGKFFLEMLRTVMLGVPKEGEKRSPEIEELLVKFKEFLVESALQIAEAFAWVCTKAEPQRERHHGWFGLAMLSTWHEARLGIVQAIEQHEALRIAILQASELPNSAVVKNLKFMLSKLRLDLDQSTVSDAAMDILHSAAANTELDGLFVD